jgi:AraC-like DNA-binding protein
VNYSLQSLRITLLNIDHVHLDRQWDYRDVISPFSRLYYIKSGTARVHHHEQVFDLKTGYLYLIPSFTYSSYKCDNEMEQIYVHFLEEAGSGLSIFNICSFRYEMPANDLDKQLFGRLLYINPNRSLTRNDPKTYEYHPTLKSYEAKNNSMPAAHYMETNAILQFLLSKFVEAKRTVFNSTGYQAHKITETLHYISANLQNKITVEQLAAKCYFNPDYFSRLFKEQTGIRPIQYIQSKRIERAQVLLTTTNYTLQAIADMVGLGNISYFNRLFTKLTNKTPAIYRKENLSI